MVLTSLTFILSVVQLIVTDGTSLETQSAVETALLTA